MKRFLAMLLCTLMLAGMLPLGVLAEEAETAEVAAAVENAAEPGAEKEQAPAEPSAKTEDAPANEEPVKEVTPLEAPEAAEVEEPAEEVSSEEPEYKEPEKEQTIAEEETFVAEAAEQPAVEELPAGEPAEELSGEESSVEKAEAPVYVWEGLSDKDFLDFVFDSGNTAYLTRLLEHKKAEEYIAFAARVEKLSEPARTEVKTYLLSLAAEEETPVEEIPTEEIPAEEIPAEETPVEEVPAEEVPAEKIPAEETPAEEVPAEEIPAEETPAEETPAEEIPAEETPVEEVPAEETPVEEVPAEETPVEEVPAEETPAEEIPAEEVLAGEIPAEEAEVLDMLGMMLMTTPQDLRELIEAAGGAAKTIDITDNVTVYDTLEIPANITINVKSGGELIVSVTGGKLKNKGTINVLAGGLMTCSNDNAYEGNYINLKSGGSITPATLPHHKEGVKVTEISDFHVGKKIPDPNKAGNYIWVAGTDIPAKAVFDVGPDNADTFEMEYTCNNGGSITVEQKGGEQYLRITPGGKTYAVTATSKSDNSVSATCQVKVEDYALNVYDGNVDPFHNIVAGGSSITITAEFKPANVTDAVLKAPAFVDSKSEQYASLSMSGGPEAYTITLDANEVTEQHVVDIKLETSDGALSEIYSVTIFPAQKDIRAIWDDGSAEGVDITGETYYYDIDTDPGLKIKALVLPADANQVVNWSYSDSNASAKVTVKNNDTDTAEVQVLARGTGNEGTLTLIGKTAAGGYIEVPIRMVHIDTTIRIDVPKNPIPGNDGFYTVRAKQSQQCSAITGADGTVKWSLVDPGDKMWGTIDETTGLFKATEYANTQKDVYEVAIKAALLINKKTEVSSATAIVKVVPSAVSAVIKMNGETFRSQDTLYMNAGIGNSWTLNGVFTPDDASFSSQSLDPQYEIPCTWTSSDESILQVKQDKNDKSKCVISTVDIGGACATGTVTLTLTANDGSSAKTSVKVNVSYQIQKINIWSNAEFTQKTSELISGKAMQLYAVVSPGTATNLKLKYEVINCDSSFVPNSDDKGVYATVSTSGKVTAKTVYSPHYVIIRATSTDGGNVQGDYKLKIMPKQAGNLLVLDKDGIDITGTTVKMDILKSMTMQLGSNEANVTYSSSKPDILAVDSTGKLTYKGAELKKAVTVTITVTDNNNPFRKATVKVTVTKLVQPGTMTVTSKTGVYDLMASKSLIMKSTVSSDALSKKVTWSVEANDKPYASISASGVLTAKGTVNEQTDVTVIATANDGSGVKATCKVTIYPKVSYIIIDDGNEVVSGKTVKVDVSEGGVSLNATVMNLDAMQGIKWTSSSKKIAEVDSAGNVTFTGKLGKVAITATSVDGSKKSAKVTFQIIAMVDQYELNLSGKNTKGGLLALRGGTTTQLNVNFINPKKPSNSKIKWEIRDAKYTAYATITSGGTLKTNKVTGEHLIEVWAIPYDDPTETNKKMFKIWVLPSVTKITLMSGSVNITGTTQNVPLSQGTINLSADIFPTDASENVTWKSSSTKYATVDSNGVVTLLKAGKVKITVTAKDGSGKSAQVTLNITK